MFNFNEPISKKNALLIFVGMCSFFAIIIFYLFKINLFSIVFEISVIFSFLGWFILTFFSEELGEKFNVKIQNPGSYQSGALGFLSLSTTAFGVFLFLLFLFNIGLFKSILYAVIYSLPFLGVGLRFNAFSDESRWIGDKDVIGYSPFYFLWCAMFVVLQGYYSAFHCSSITDGIIIFIITTLSYLWIIFPDKVNKYLPFDNRELIGLVIYLGFILVVFSFLINQFDTVTFTGLMQSWRD